MTVKVFISYRRDDSAGHAGRVHDRLEREFGRDLLFMDVDAIPLGANFVKVLGEEVAKCGVLLAIIGPGWLDARDEDGHRRLDNPHDFVRLEIATALKRDIPVIPILLEGTRVPKAHMLPEDLQELALRNGLDVRHASFHNDMDKLIRGLRETSEVAGGGHRPKAGARFDATPAELALPAAPIGSSSGLDPAISSRLVEIAIRDPHFSPEPFLRAAISAYSTILAAFSEGDRRTLANLLCSEVFDAFAGAIIAREERGERLDQRLVRIEKADIVEAQIRNDHAGITVRFVSLLITATRDRAGSVISGDPEHPKVVTDVWTFMRDISSPRALKDSNWLLVATGGV